MMKKLLLVLLFLTSFISAEAEVKPFHVEKKYFLTYDKNTTCLVRHIPVYKDPKWVAKIEVRNKKTVYFSSPKSMFEFYHRPGKWFDVGVKSERDFAKIVVTDYATAKPINAEAAFYVYGSRATSPAGDDLPAFKNEQEAKKFIDENGGNRILKFDEVSDSLIRLLNGRI
jgi:nitrous oxide reductase accessory protein NosL